MYIGLKKWKSILVRSIGFSFIYDVSLNRRHMQGGIFLPLPIKAREVENQEALYHPVIPLMKVTVPEISPF